MTDHALLEAEGIAYQYPNARGVQEIDLQLGRGEILGLLGLNGAGKSTTLRLLAGILRPTTGVVRVAGHGLRPGSPNGRNRLGYLPEVAPLYPEYTVDEQLHFSARLYGLRGKAARAATTRARQRCGLEAVGRRRIQALSQGMRRRLGLAQAMVHEPAVLLLDEPTVALDPVQIIEVRTLIRDLSRDSAVILSSHLLAEVETICSRVAVLHEGRLVHQQALDGSARTARLLVGLARDPGIDAFRTVAGDAAVNALGEGRYLVDAVEASDLAARIVERNWGLRELTPQAESLERTFIALTRGGEAVEA